MTHLLNNSCLVALDYIGWWREREKWWVSSNTLIIEKKSRLTGDLGSGIGDGKWLWHFGNITALSIVFKNFRIFIQCLF